MRNECNIIRDLLPLYAENMVSSDTSDYVDEHLKGCESCRKEYEKTKEPQPNQEISDAAPLFKLRRKMKVKRIQTITLTAIFVITILASAFAVLDAPIYLPYSEKLVTPEQLGDKGMLLTFNEEVRDFDYTVYEDPDGGNLYYCDIQAWTSLWNQWFSQGKGKQSATVSTGDSKPIIAAYVPGDGSENICIAKYDPNAKKRIDKNVQYGNKVTLPRLSLSYYLFLAAALLAILVIAWFVTRKKAKLRIWIERISLYPISYMVSHCIVSGIHWASYSLARDFSLTIFISILLYSSLLLSHNVWRQKKENNATNR